MTIAKWLIKFVLFCWYVVSLPTLQAQNSVIFQTYNTSHGLVSDYVYQVFQDRDGFMWFTTDKGISRYDGREFRNFTTENGLPKNMVSQIVQAGDGALWVRFQEGGLGRYDGVHFRYFPAPTPVGYLALEKQGNVSLMEATQEPNISRRYYYYFKDGKNYDVPKVITKPAQPDVYDGVYDIVPHHPSNQIEAMYMLKHKKGSFYIFKPTYQPYTYLQIQDSIRLPENTHIMSNLPIDKNTFWIGTQQGLYYKEGKQVRHFTEKEGLANNFINHIYQDYEGNIWLATFGGGVQKIKATHLVHYEIGLDNTKVHDAWQTGKQDFEVAHDTGIQPIRAGKAQTRLFIENNMRCIVPQENSFYTSNFEYIFTLNAQGQILHKVLNTNGIADIAKWQGRWYAATFGQGVVEIGRDSTKVLFEKYFPATGLMTERLVRTKDYLWWLTHEHGVQAIDKNLQLTHLDGLAGKGVYDVFEQKNGTLWFATNKGVTKINAFVGAGFTPAQTQNKPKTWEFEERVTTVFEWAGKMWAIGDKFLYTSFEEKGVLKWRKWGSVPILPAPDMKINKAIFRADFANVLLCTNRGLLVLDLQKIILPTTALKSLQLLDLQIDSTKQKINFQEKVHFSPTENNLTFRFAGLSFLEESRNVLRYELISPTGKRVGKLADMKLTLNGLVSGNYTLHVWLENPNGITSKVWQARFEIATPFWWQWWFWAISALFVSAITGLVVRFFIRQVYQKRIKQMEVEHKIQMERQRISRDLHDNVGAQLSYILRTLDNLSSESENARLQNLQFFAKETMRNLRESIWAIQKESITTTELFLRFKKYVQTFAQDTHLPTISLQQNLPTEQTLSPTQALHLFRMLQEALQNALKHSQASVINILFDASKEGNFCITLQDDGVGFDVEAGKAKEGHYGLRNLQERTQEIGAKLSLESEAGKGTIFRVQL